MLVRRPEDFIAKFLVQDGDTNTDLSVDGSSTPVNFDYLIPDDESFLLSRLLFRLEDTAIAMTKFGGIAALTNGITIKILGTDLDNTKFDAFNGATIKKNDDFALIAGESILLGAGTDAFMVRYTLLKSGALMRIDGGERVRIVVADNLTGITEFHVTVQGFKVSRTTSNSLIESP